MKTIKGKSEDYVSGFHPIIQRICKESFEAGANYVLECFESVLPFVVKKGIIYGKIKETIEQLKGNQ